MRHSLYRFIQKLKAGNISAKCINVASMVSIPKEENILQDCNSVLYLFCNSVIHSLLRIASN